jgi:CheY-like chemotaxis protein
VILRPLAGPAAAAPPAVAAEIATGATILVIDDEPEVADVLSDMLVRDDHHVDVAYGGRDALERIHRPLRSGGLRSADARHRRSRAVPAAGGDGSPPGPALPRGDRRIRARDTRAFLTRSGVPALAKPLVLDDMRGAIRELLARD